ncbi:P2X purinoceptor 4 isoform X2 [Lingula anatina]|uniref:P2X purinoceptor 4 isoform X2 n=1 Tax=Lingula anatina TaxID=7574 RepID=A0A1S3HEZ1_LINAN|nr:P2X purinoceptor 4 isoform X2 [Lingula anatina]|eukprot:XP_013384595.1 P2X purinoceptor 4 isoform X2 [Lingula anatina]
MTEKARHVIPGCRILISIIVVIDINKQGRMSCATCCGYLKGALVSFFEYDTPKIVHIKSKKVGLLNRTVQLAVILYIVIWVIVIKKGYQDTDIPISAATTKLKGVDFTNITKVPSIGARIWDVADYVIPPQEKDAFFVMTNMIITPNQTQGVCGEDPELAPCTDDSECTKDMPVPVGSGVMTGVCNKATNSCEIHAWCPVEIDEPPLKDSPVLTDSKDFTVLIKNYVYFPKFNVRRRNIPDWIKKDKYLSKCRWSRDKDPYCPIFRLEDLISAAGEDYLVMAYKGGVIDININWDCNLDYAETNCRPTYTISRVDKNETVSPGWNFRYADFYVVDGVNTRTLYKAYGIRFIITITGKAGKFNIVPMLLNIGAGLGLLTLSTVLSDIVVLYFLKYRSFYREKKYQNVDEMDVSYQELEGKDFGEPDPTNSVRHRPLGSNANNDSET